MDLNKKKKESLRSDLDKQNDIIIIDIIEKIGFFYVVYKQL